MNEQAWCPDGFDGYRSLFPATPSLEPLPDAGPTDVFSSLWDELAATSTEALRARFEPLARHTTVVFVRGYLGGFMPGNLAAPARAARGMGFDAWLAPVRGGATVEENVGHLARSLQQRRGRDKLVFCGHSKGGIESLLLLSGNKDIAARCAGVILSQTPRGPSRVLECLLDREHDETLARPYRRLAVAVQRRGLRLIGGARGGRQLTAPRILELTRDLLSPQPPWPVLQTASWSSRPTTWLDSFHERLGEIRPGCAHDGQFYLEDLLWPELPHVLLPHLDHAQPVVGGYGFPHARYWLIVLLMLMEGSF